MISKCTYLFVINELRLEPKFCEVGRAHFQFLVNDNPVIENYMSLLYTIENTVAPISAYRSILFCIGEPRPTPSSTFPVVAYIIWMLPSDRVNESYGTRSFRPHS
jgi:hypothetical protein